MIFRLSLILCRRRYSIFKIFKLWSIENSLKTLLTKILLLVRSSNLMLSSPNTILSCSTGNLILRSLSTPEKMILRDFKHILKTLRKSILELNLMLANFQSNCLMRNLNSIIWTLSKESKIMRRESQDYNRRSLLMICWSLLRPQLKMNLLINSLNYGKTMNLHSLTTIPKRNNMSFLISTCIQLSLSCCTFYSTS